MEDAARTCQLPRWPDACAVRATLHLLKEDCASQNKLLEQVRQHLLLTSSAHSLFVQAGGVQVLCSFLSSSSSKTQNNCLGALEALALNEDVRSDLLETVLAERMFYTVRTNRSMRCSSIRQMAGTIIKLLAGWRPGGFLCAASSVGLNSTRALLSSFASHHQRDRPFPLWCYTTNPSLPWDGEAVSCLVEILSTDLGKDVQETSERVIQKILRERNASGHIILKKRDMANLVGVISSMHSSATIAMEAVAIMCIMHPSNEITFVRTGGFESLLQAIKSDNIGNICGEMAAWAIAYFASKSVDSCHKIVNFGGAEALVELLHSSDKCAREASARACVALLRNLGKSNFAIRQKFGDANAIPALLSALRDGQSQERSESIVMDVLWTLMEFAKAKEHRKEILDAGGLEALKESATGSNVVIQDAAKKLNRVLLSKSARLRNSLGSQRMNCRFVQMMARRLRRLFCYRANIDCRKSRRNEITDWACGNFPIHPPVASSTIQAEHLASCPRVTNSTVSLTSFRVKMCTSNATQPLETQSTTTPVESHKHIETASFIKQERPVNFEAKIECRESDAQTSVRSPSMQDLAVVVVTLTTQSSLLSDSQHQGNFMDSSQSNLIATCDFI